MGAKNGLQTSSKYGPSSDLFNRVSGGRDIMRNPVAVDGADDGRRAQKSVALLSNVSRLDPLPPRGG